MVTSPSRRRFHFEMRAYCHRHGAAASIGSRLGLVVRRCPMFNEAATRGRHARLIPARKMRPVQSRQSFRDSGS